MFAALRPIRPLALIAAIGLAACAEEQGAYGDASSIVTAVPTAVWEQLEDSVYGALEPTIYTVRDEKTFTVTHVDPNDGATWGDLMRFRQLLVVGPADASWIEPVLRKARDEDRGNAVVQAFDVWARGQTVTAVVTDAADVAGGFLASLDELHALYDRQFRQLAEARMFVSGPDSALVDTLMNRAGFSLMLPTVYTWDARDSVYIFRNDNPDPSELIRQVAVTWASPIPQGMEGEDFLAWRQEIADAYYSDEQVAVLDNLQGGRFDHEGLDAYQIQAVWQSPPGAWPAGGPFVLRAVACPAQDRMYLLDGWLYAPGKEKYEFMIQLERILDSFQCAT
ncbi:DUF4837 family protein [Gaopeijia maritima]|uniref:DUF4837 family protein n=1 Tax=Gaopeijia maritima TaxID=3119007 RepID=A0ABU9ED26_9BACT